MAILNDVLPFACPACRGKIAYDKGCMAMRHDKAKGGCGASFYVFCEGLFDNPYGHVPDCTANILKVPWLHLELEADAVFARVRQIRHLKPRFAEMDETLREAVFLRVEQHLRDLKIARGDVL